MQYTSPFRPSSLLISATTRAEAPYREPMSTWSPSPAAAAILAKKGNDRPESAALPPRSAKTFVTSLAISIDSGKILTYYSSEFVLIFPSTNYEFEQHTPKECAEVPLLNPLQPRQTLPTSHDHL